MSLAPLLAVQVLSSGVWGVSASGSPILQVNQGHFFHQPEEKTIIQVARDGLPVVGASARWYEGLANRDSAGRSTACQCYKKLIRQSCSRRTFQGHWHAWKYMGPRPTGTGASGSWRMQWHNSVQVAVTVTVCSKPTCVRPP